MKYGKLSIIENSDFRKPVGKTKINRLFCKAKCECGKVIVVSKSHLNSGHTKSCGCFAKQRQKETFQTHGQTGSSAYSSWSAMKTRCLNKNIKEYHCYGGRGITISKEWQKFENFYRDMGDRPKGMTLDRIDNNKGYSKENCRWATYKEQANNTRRNHMVTVNGEKMNTLQASILYNINLNTALTRIRIGWSESDAFSIPPFTPGIRKSRGENSPTSKIKEKQVRKLIKQYKTGNYSVRSLANMYSISKSQIYNIVTRKSWKHLD